MIMMMNCNVNSIFAKPMLKSRMTVTNFSYQTSMFAKRENYDGVARELSDQELWQCAQFKRISSKDI